MFNHIMHSRYLCYREDSQTAIEEHPVTPNLPLRNGCIWQQQGARETH